MKAPTVEVEGALLIELERIKPASQSLTTYVRSVLLREVRRQQMMAAVDSYSDFLRRHAAARAWLEEWARADLAHAPRRKRR